jgi:hypothetical protein
MEYDKATQRLLERFVQSEYPLCLGYQQLTVAASAVKFTVPLHSNRAIIIVESTISAPSFAIRFTEDGTTPTASAGMPRCNGEAFEVTDIQNLNKFMAIQVAGGTHKLNIQYYK